MPTPKASFTLRGRNPDVLTCIANLSNDEVFTPPEFANRMLDTLAEAWAKDNKGANIWANSSIRFLDPCTKSGVFLREITSRLTKGLEKEIPDLEKRVDHILTKQVFGIAITQLTSLLARRSLYCSKHAKGKYSIAKHFASDDGNVWFKSMKHTWAGDKCKFCSAPRSIFGRNEGLETHAYAIIHADDVKARVTELFGGIMQFDVIVGNPPYQMKGGAGGTSDSSIYHLFVEQAMRLDPRFLSMVIPSRWLAGGRGMEDFRQTMLTNKHITRFVDYTKTTTPFPGAVDFEGGIGYFLWERDRVGECEYTLVLGDEELPTAIRKLDEFDIFVRDTRAVGIIKKVIPLNEPSMRGLVSGDTPFGLATNFNDFAEKPSKGSIKLFLSLNQKRVVKWIKDSVVTKNRQLIPAWKLFLPKAYGERGAIPANVLGPSIIASPGSICTQTYVVCGPFGDESEAVSCDAYLRTRFARFLVSLRKITQDLPRGTYSWVPQQRWDRKWTDAALYKKYKLDKDEIAFIESMIRPMDSDDE
jgi:site-specific DNA-methyltransferase (adenine-specific)